MEIVILFMTGLIFGSFAGAQVWRLRARQLMTDSTSGIKLQEDEQRELRRLRPLLDKTFRSDRSQCLHCKHALGLVDLLPLVSWLSTGGKCRYCGVAIGWFEPLVELGTALLFVVSYLFWPWPLVDVFPFVLFGLWLVAIVLFVILFAYDTKWFLLPDRIVWSLAIIGVIFAVSQIAGTTDSGGLLLSLTGAVALLSGLYAGLYYYSLWRSGGSSTWVGFGDVKLGLVLALFLVDWRLAFLTLFLANFIGSLVVIPGLLLKLLDRGAHIPFGPLLIAGFFISFFWGDQIINWFLYSGNLLVLY